jgi:hypothetical protein
VAAITAVFDADFARRAVSPGGGADLVWSPKDLQDKLLALINGATSSLRIYSEEMGDTTVETPSSGRSSAASTCRSAGRTRTASRQRLH